jgi:hypothetical protein
MLDYLGRYTAARSVHLLRLETGIHQREAIGLYERWGFSRCGPFGEYVVHPMSIYFERRIGHAAE